MGSYSVKMKNGKSSCKAMRVYPINKSDSDSIAIKMSHSEAKRLIELLEEGIQQFHKDEITITGFKKSNQVTVTCTTN